MHYEISIESHLRRNNSLIYKKKKVFALFRCASRFTVHMHTNTHLHAYVNGQKVWRNNMILYTMKDEMYPWHYQIGHTLLHFL